MFQIANLKVDPLAVELIPECIARENCVLPVRIEDGKLHVVLGRRSDPWETIDKLQFILDRTLVCAVSDRDSLERAIDEVYANQAVEVQNCPIDFRTPCPRRWLELQPTDQADVRFCEGCHREVYLCSDEEHALRQANLGHCVAVFRVVEDEGMDLLGALEVMD